MLSDPKHLNGNGLMVLNEMLKPLGLSLKLPMQILFAKLKEVANE